MCFEWKYESIFIIPFQEGHVFGHNDLYLCVCVCVCVREGWRKGGMERGREGGREGGRDGKREYDMFRQLSVKVSLPIQKNFKMSPVAESSPSHS